MQGVFAPKTYGDYGLPGSWNGALEWQYPPHQRQGAYEEEGRAVNTLKVRRLLHSYRQAHAEESLFSGRFGSLSCPLSTKGTVNLDMPSGTVLPACRVALAQQTEL